MQPARFKLPARLQQPGLGTHRQQQTTLMQIFSSVEPAQGGPLFYRRAGLPLGVDKDAAASAAMGPMHTL
jgi:hypothetical protein